MGPQVSQRHVLDLRASLRRSESEKSSDPIARFVFVGMNAINASSAVLTLQEGCLNDERL